MIKGIYDTFASRWYHNGSIWIYSDPHFNDPESAALRKNYIGDAEQIKLINSIVGKNDTLIILGDIGSPDRIRFLRGYKVLIMGNHDAGASNYKREIRHIYGLPHCPICNGDVVYSNMIYEDCGPGYAWCPTCGCTVIPTRDQIIDNHLFDEVYEGPLMVSDRLILSHEPIENLPKYMYNIHGHDHSNSFLSDRHLNVCAEHIGYTPLNLTKLLRQGLLKDIDSIHRTTIDRAIIRKAKSNGGHKK